MKNQHNKRLVKAVVVAAFLAESASVIAAGAIEEVIVTARKRDESIMKVPTTTSVLSKDMLEKYAVSDLKGMANNTPGLNFSPGPMSSGLMVSMRGVGSGTNNPAVHQSVALVADGMQFTQGLAFAASTFDMSQVEVLKGPQSLIFGKAAPAGVIVIHTADPSDEFEARISASYEFEGQESIGEVVLSGPLTDTLGARVALQYSELKGYFDNESVPANNPPPYGSMGGAPVDDRFPARDTLAGRLTLVWAPSDDLEAKLKYNYNDSDTQGYGGEPTLVSCPDGTSSNFIPPGTGALPTLAYAAGVDFISGADCKANDKWRFSYLDPAAFANVPNGGVPFNESTQQFGTLELNYELSDGLTVTSVSGIYDLDQGAMINGSLTTDVGTPFGIATFMDTTEYTQELRLTSTYDGPLNFLFGGLYQESDMEFLAFLPANKTYPLIGIPLGIAAAGTEALFRATHNIDTETQSLFGQILWNVTPDLELSAGVRWTDEEKHHQVLDQTPEQQGMPAHQVALARPVLAVDVWTPELTLTYTPTDEMTYYASYKKAYKAGSFDVGGTASDGEDKAFDDEKVDGYEAGIKSIWLDGRFNLNVAAYLYQYENMQVEASVIDPGAGDVGVSTANAGSSELYGIDTDMTYVPEIEGLRLFAGINWNIAEYTEFDNANCFTGQLWSEGCNQDANGDGIGESQDLAGEPLLRAPKWMLNAGVDYELLNIAGLNLNFGVTSTYSSSYSASAYNYDEAYQDAYYKVNATIGVSDMRERWRIDVIGNNLTDEYTFGNCVPGGYQDNLAIGNDPAVAGTGSNSQGPGGRPENACWVERGRSIQVRLSMNLF